MKPRIALSALLLVFLAPTAIAQTYEVCTRVGLWRPGCVPESQGFQRECVVEVTNFDPNYWYRISIVGRDAVPGASCGSTPCEGAINGILELAPQNQSGYCKWTNTMMPSNSSCHSCSDDPNSSTECSAHDCDNRQVTNPNCNGDCERTCDNASTEWCVELVDLQVKITHVGSMSHGVIQWTDVTDRVIANKGSYGLFPKAEEQSYCTNHAPIFIPGSPPPATCQTINYGE